MGQPTNRDRFQLNIRTVRLLLTATKISLPAWKQSCSTAVPHGNNDTEAGCGLTRPSDKWQLLLLEPVMTRATRRCSRHAGMETTPPPPSLHWGQQCSSALAASSEYGASLATCPAYPIMTRPGPFRDPSRDFFLFFFYVLTFYETLRLGSCRIVLMMVGSCMLAFHLEPCRRTSALDTLEDKPLQ